jgi:hypothetical protein
MTVQDLAAESRTLIEHGSKRQRLTSQLQRLRGSCFTFLAWSYVTGAFTSPSSAANDEATRANGEPTGWKSWETYAQVLGIEMRKVTHRAKKSEIAKGRKLCSCYRGKMAGRFALPRLDAFVQMNAPAAFTVRLGSILGSVSSQHAGPLDLVITDVVHLRLA